MSEYDHNHFDYDFVTYNREKGEYEYFRTFQVGGKDEDGIYELVLDGPAQGEKAYL